MPKEQYRKFIIYSFVLNALCAIESLYTPLQCQTCNFFSVIIKSNKHMVDIMIYRVTGCIYATFFNCNPCCSILASKTDLFFTALTLFTLVISCLFFPRLYSARFCTCLLYSVSKPDMSNSWGPNLAREVIFVGS